jgi:hypothetical protein
MLTFEVPPATDIPAPSTSDIRTALTARPGDWAVVYRADRLARAQAFADAVNAGSKFGPDMRAVVRKVGPECRVYAMSTAV